MMLSTASERVRAFVRRFRRFEQYDRGGIPVQMHAVACERPRAERTLKRCKTKLPPPVPREHETNVAIAETAYVVVQHDRP